LFSYFFQILQKLNKSFIGTVLNKILFNINLYVAA